MKTPFDTSDANRKFDAAEKKLAKLILQVAAGDREAERAAFRTVDTIDDLRRWHESGSDPAAVVTIPQIRIKASAEDAAAAIEAIQKIVSNI